MTKKSPAGWRGLCVGGAGMVRQPPGGRYLLSRAYARVSASRDRSAPAPPRDFARASAAKAGPRPGRMGAPGARSCFLLYLIFSLLRLKKNQPPCNRGWDGTGRAPRITPDIQGARICQKNRQGNVKKMRRGWRPVRDDLCLPGAGRKGAGRFFRIFMGELG